ncbi:MAG: hypothetical protein IJS47_01750 [Clostridia bacterium]|nr:hypothetical protein [Clostridia bacterium]
MTLNEIIDEYLDKVKADPNMIVKALSKATTKQSRYNLIIEFIKSGAFKPEDLGTYLPAYAKEEEIWTRLIKMDFRYGKSLPNSLKKSPKMMKLVENQKTIQELQKIIKKENEEAKKEEAKKTNEAEEPHFVEEPLKKKEPSKKEQRLQKAQKVDEEEKKGFERNGDEHPLVGFAKKFLSLNLPNEAFASKYDSWLVKSQITSRWDIAESKLAVYRPDMYEKCVAHDKEVRDEYYKDLADITTGLTTGTLSVYDFAKTNDTAVKIGDIFSKLMQDGRMVELRALDEQVISTLGLGNLTFKDLYRMFADEFTLESVKHFVKIALDGKQRGKGIIGRNKDLEWKDGPLDKCKFGIKQVLPENAGPYVADKYIGYREKKDLKTGEVRKVDITPELLDKITAYIEKNDGYVYNVSVENIIDSLLNGTLTMEDLGAKAKEIESDEIGKAIAEFNDLLKKLNEVNKELNAQPSHETAKVNEEVRAKIRSYDGFSR